MSKVTIPEPVAKVMDGYSIFWAGSGPIFPLVDRNKVKVGSLLITTDQAEAYAAAKVREALEEAQVILTGMYTDAVKARVPEGDDEEGWNSHCLERALALQDAVLKIRALLPSTPA